MYVLKQYRIVDVRTAYEVDAEQAFARHPLGIRESVPAGSSGSTGIFIHLGGTSTMNQTDMSVRVAGAWLAVASFLMVVVFGLHGPIDPDLAVQMAKVADAPIRWAVVHWMAAAALSFYAVTGLVVLTSRSRLTGSGWSLTAWAVLTVGALWTMTTAVAETTVVTQAAVSGSGEAFEAWWTFAEGKANGFAFLALALAVVAGKEARDPAAATPTWSAWTAMGAGGASFAGWTLGMWFGVGFGNMLWVAASLVMSLWSLYFGIVLMRVQPAYAEDRHALIAE